MFNKSKKPHAQIINNTMVLSLPDAMTPVVWVFDMNETKSFFVKIEQNDAGLFVLQKIVTSSKKIEDIAYYSERKQALCAMGLIARMDTKKALAPSDVLAKFGKILKLSVMILLAALISYLVFYLYDPLDERIASVNNGETETTVSNNQPSISSNTDAVGVPMSADDFLNKKSPLGFPF